MIEREELRQAEAVPEQDTQPVAVGKKELAKARQLLQRYKDGKKNLEARVKAAEQWYKLRHWDYIREGEQQSVEPVSAWLFNAIANKHADAMDNFPAPNILPREAGDRELAQRLTAIVPVAMKQAGFEAVYSENCDCKLRSGTGVYGVFWNPKKLNGLGDVDIQAVDIMNLFWQPGIRDIQSSRNVFHVELVDRESLEEEYPEHKGGFGSGTENLTKYEYEDSVDTSDKALVVDWYYKKQAGRRQVLHYCKFCGDTVLYASENDPQYAQRGYYDHGEYPFYLDALFKVKGSPCGFGYVDLGKSAQEYIDRANQALMKNLLHNANPKYFFNGEDGAINEEEFSDPAKTLVHVDGQLGEDSIRPVEKQGLPGIYATIVQDKINEIKEVTGNRDVSNGGSSSGVTAASAIAAMQEAGSKLSRDSNKQSYRVFCQIVNTVIELIRQFYNQERSFRITGEGGQEEFVRFGNGQIKPQLLPAEAGVPEGYRLPVFDVEITAQKQSPYSKMSQNELAIQFYGNGFFNPQNADQALACLEFMDFDRKESVMNRIRENGGMYQQILQMQQQMTQMSQIIDRLTGSTLGQGVSTGAPAGGSPRGAGSLELSGITGEEAKVTKQARERVANSTAAR